MIRKTLLFLLIAGGCYAQDSLRFDKLIPRTAVKFSPLTMANFYPTLELSFEQKIARRISVQIGYGYVLDYKRNDSPEYQNKRGYKAKLEIRYYLIANEKRDLVCYISPGGYVNAVDFDRRVSQQECYDLSCTNTFTRTYNYVVNYREQGFTLKFGFVKHFSKSIFMDINGGWSFRFIDYDEPTIPQGLPDFAMQEQFITGGFPVEEDRFIPTPLFGFRIGYRFR